MMNCAEFEVLLADSLDGALSRADREAFAQHLADCEACAALARDAQSALTFMELAAEMGKGSASSQASRQP